MTGRHFKSMNLGSDQLRKLGEAGKLRDSVFRVPGMKGFHHSWLGDTEMVAQKISAYAHSRNDHDSDIYDNNGALDLEKISERIATQRSVYKGSQKLEIRNDVDFLPSLSEERFSNLFL